MPLNLSPDEALIFRITHVDNLPWILDNGLHARNGEKFDPGYRNIGNPDLIEKRSKRSVKVPPGGTLSDYVPFYFTPYSIMLYNIKTGYGGVKQVPNSEILILVSSLRRVAARGIPFAFTNQHAYPAMAEYFTDLERLDSVDWTLLQRRDFKHDPDDPGKKERYQAEALIWKYVPLDALQGVCCYEPEVKGQVEAQVRQRGLDLKVGVQPNWYF
jgi:hypothetical protein